MNCAAPPDRHQLRQGADRGICRCRSFASPIGEVVYFPSNLIENLFLSNGMSAGNTLAEAQVQCLSEIFERAVKREIIEQEIALPDVPMDVLKKYPDILEGVRALEAKASRCWSRMPRWAAASRWPA